MLAIGIGVVGPVYSVKGEVFPLQLRTSATALTTAVSWASSFLLTSGFLSLINSRIGSVSNTK